ncbi:MAG TPA: DAK2 domain-containing protein [Syntrophorhabdaceae bacterium]|nr:DAK2 domain-containing protein [Syntrophorhabdaceae bacterium]
MAILYCTGKRFKQIIAAGAHWVMKNRDQLNKINVFPVPDGDTGSNMSATLTAAVREMELLKEDLLEPVAKAAAWGSLMGARGNSGIIMAQILSGLAEKVQGRDRLSAEDLALAFVWAGEKARKAILHPAEGTILTVIRDTAQAGQEIAGTERDLGRLLDGMVAEARSSVERTPLLLPKLKEAGVVDAGGLGFFYFLEGMQLLVQGTALADSVANGEGSLAVAPPKVDDHRWNFRYCTEFILKGSQISEDAIKNSLASMGDSLVVVGDTRLARVHIHTGQPEDVLQYASRLGQVSSIKVDDMLVQHTARFQDTSRQKQTSVVAVTLGDGFKELFYNAGAELVVDGGPTSNPSIADLVAAVEAVTSSHVVILPNHKNVYPAAVQAAQMTPKNVTVLKTASAAHGLSAMLAYMDDASVEENLSRMEEAFERIKTGEVVQASRSVLQGGVKVEAGDSIGIFGGAIRISCAEREDAALGLIASMIDPSDEIVTLYHGESVPIEDAQALQSAVQCRYQGTEIELYYGGQPYSHYIVCVE